MVSNRAINRIPNEILLEIFLVYRSMLLEQLDERRLKPSPLSNPERNTPLAGATHVCRHWRQVALNCPFLWVNIALTSPESVAPFLERSRNAPLSITGKIRGKINLLSDQRMLQEVFSRSQQIRSLHLELHHGSLLALPASQPVFAQLTALSLQTDYQTDGEVDLPPFSNSLVHFPALRELSLNMYSFGPSKRLFSSVLRKLVYESLTSCPQWTDVLFSLEGMPLLEEVTFACEMEGAIPPFDPDSIVLDSINKSVALPHLCKLKLQSGALHCGTLLAHLVVPSSVAYHLIIPNDLETPGHEEFALANSDKMLAAIMPPIMKAFNGTNQPKGSRNITAFALALGIIDSDCHLLICQSDPTYDHIPLAKHGQALRLEVENFWDRAVMEVVVPALSLHNVEFLQLTGRQNGTVDPPPWTGLLERMPLLKDFLIMRSAADYLPQLLSHQLDVIHDLDETDLVPSARRLLTPRLQGLTIVEDTPYFEEWGTSDWKPGQWVSRLVHALEVRQNMGADRLQALKFEHCRTVDRNTIDPKMLKDCAVNVSVMF